MWVLTQLLHISPLQEQIRRLKRQLAQKPQGTDFSVPSKEIATAIKTALQRQQQQFAQEKQQLETRVEQLFNALLAVARAIAPVIETAPIAAGEKEIPASPPPQKPGQPIRDEKPVANGIKRILRVLASRYPMTFTKPQLATLARLSARGGAYIRYLSHLKSQGFITADKNRIALTKEELAAPGTLPQSGEQPIDMWRGNLSGGARCIFDFLVASYPTGFTRDDIGGQVGLKARGGAFGRYLSILRNNGLIDMEVNKIKASETLFLR